MAFLLLLDSTRRGTGCLGDSLAGSKRESRYDENQRSAPTAPISPRYTLRGRARLSYALRCWRLYRRRRMDGRPGSSFVPPVFPLPGQVMPDNEERGNRKVVEHKLPRRPRRLISCPAYDDTRKASSRMCVKRDEAHLAAARQAGSGDVINNVRDPLARLPGHGLWRTMTPAPCKIAPPHNADET